MKKPNLNKLKLNKIQTNKIHSLSQRAKSKSVKITINLDAISLTQLKEISLSSGIPYQRILNNLLKESLNNKKSSDSRLDKIEKEISLLKKRLVA